MSDYVGSFVFTDVCPDVLEKLLLKVSFFLWNKMHINPNSLDNEGSWRILKDFYCSVTMLRELGLSNNVLKYQLNVLLLRM